MLRVPDRALPKAAATRLRQYQQEIDAVEIYPDRVSAAKQRFAACNRRSNTTFRVVRETLQAMCGGIVRCMYCDDSMADEIEHFRPKDLYPEAVFSWPNLLYACGPCNGSKRHRFFVFTASEGKLVEVTRAWRAEVVPPVAGTPVLIHPREDDPLELLALDLRSTFRFLPRARRGTRAYDRARLTVEVLNLNDRVGLPEARRAAFESFLALLERYVREKDRGSDGALANVKRAISSQQHPTVWAEMKRQRQSFERLRRLFDHSAEALDW